MSGKLGKFPLDDMYCGDALTLMQDIPKRSLDLIVTDPPFAIEFTASRNNYNRTDSRVLRGYREISGENYGEFSRDWIGEAARILKDTGSMYVFSGWNRLKEILIGLEDAHLTTINHLIWKYQFGVFTKRKYVTSHYHILFAVKDPKRYVFNKIEHYPEDVWVINREYWTGKVKTPTKLPLELVKRILLFSSKRGDLVLDPFAGSGTVAVASKELGRHFLGFEIVPEYYEFARERVQSAAPKEADEIGVHTLPESAQKQAKAKRDRINAEGGN
jgi:site-specific DNA-methyltransferase (adenine-specific)